MKIGLIIAMDKEYRMFCELLGGDGGWLGGNEIVLSHCGIGKVNAAVGALRLIEAEQPDCVISSGVAGGVDRTLDVMDIVVADEVEERGAARRDDFVEMRPLAPEEFL